MVAEEEVAVRARRTRREMEGTLRLEEGKGDYRRHFLVYRRGGIEPSRLVARVATLRLANSRGLA